MKRLIFLGNASNSLGDLNTSAFAIEVKEADWILVDCGPDTPRRLLNAGVALLDLGTLVITHRHLDHCLGVPYLLFARRLEVLARKREDPDFVPTSLRIVAEGSIWSRLYELLKAFHPESEALTFSVELLEIGSFLNSPKSLGEIQLQAVEMNHAVPSFGIVLWNSSGDKVLAYSSDSLPVDDFAKVAERVEVLVYEAMVPASEASFSDATKHSTTEHAGQVIAQVSPKRAFLMHIRPVYWSRREQLEKEVSEIAGANAVYPEDGLIVNLN